MCCGKNNEALMEEDFSADKPIAYPVQTARDEKPPPPPSNGRSGLKVILAVLCGSLLLGFLVYLVFSSSSANGSTGSEVTSSSSGTSGTSGTPLSPVPSSSSSADGVQYPARPPSLEFYVYRAQGASAAFDPENINVADLAGVFQYLHNDVVVTAPRRYQYDRINRWKVTMRTTQEYWNVHHSQFGHFIEFGSGGRCTANCGAPSGMDPDTTFKHYGYVVGCKAAEAGLSGYKAKTQTRSCEQGGSNACQTHAPILYSLPGECPTKAFEEGHALHVADHGGETKDEACKQANPGGRCDQAPTGAPDCTFQMEDAGEISLNELAGFEDQQAYDNWWQNNTGHEDGNNVEYLPSDDAGVNWNWWNQKFDEDRCTERIARAERLFAEKYPAFGELQEPPCDFTSWSQDEFALPINHTLGVSPARGFIWI